MAKDIGWMPNLLIPSSLVVTDCKEDRRTFAAFRPNFLRILAVPPAANMHQLNVKENM